MTVAVPVAAIDILIKNQGFFITRNSSLLTTFIIFLFRQNIPNFVRNIYVNLKFRIYQELYSF